MTNQQSRRWISIFIFLAIVAVIITYMFLYWHKDEMPEGIAFGNGRLEAIEVDITTKYGGRLAAVLSREGDKVELNQALARIDTRELDAKLRQAEAEVRRAQQERSVALAIIAQRKSELSLAQKDMQRAKGLYENDSISLEQFERDETSVDTARATLAAAQANVSNAEAAIEAAIANVELIRTQRDDSILRAPIKGSILYRLAEPGEVLAAGGKVLTMFDPADIYMTLFLPAHEAARVAVGAEARVVLDGIEEIAIPARVSFVAPSAQFTPKEVETRTEREKLMFRIKVQLDNDFLKKHAALAKAGIPGVAYIRMDEHAQWPSSINSESSSQQTM